MEFKPSLNHITPTFPYRTTGPERKFLGKRIGIEICTGWKKNLHGWVRNRCNGHSNHPWQQYSTKAKLTRSKIRLCRSSMPLPSTWFNSWVSQQPEKSLPSPQSLRPTLLPRYTVLSRSPPYTNMCVYISQLMVSRVKPLQAWSVVVSVPW